MLDDRQAQTRAARLTRTPAVDAVEALGQSRQVLRRYADAGIANAVFAAAVPSSAPSRDDAPAVGRVADRIGHEVGEGARQLEFRAEDRGVSIDLEGDVVSVCGELSRGLLDAREQARRVDEVFHGCAVGFERRERQQVIDQPLHALGLFAHQCQVVGLLLLRQARLAERFEKARQHRQRRLEFVGNIGDEVAAHRFKFFETRDVARQDQLLCIAVGDQLQRKHAFGAVAGVAKTQLHRPVPFATHQIRQKIGRPDEVDDVLADVFRQAQVQMLLGLRVAPHDLILRVERDDAIGQGLRCATKTRERFGQARMLALGRASPVIELRVELFPRARRSRQGRAVFLPRPAPQIAQMDRVAQVAQGERRGGERKGIGPVGQRAHDQRHDRHRADKKQGPYPDSIHGARGLFDPARL